MIPDRRRTITVRFGPDAVADICVRVFDGGMTTPGSADRSGRASPNAEHGHESFFQAIADPELVEQLRAFVRGDFAMSDLAGNGIGPTLRQGGA